MASNDGSIVPFRVQQNILTDSLNIFSDSSYPISKTAFQINIVFASPLFVIILNHQQGVEWKSRVRRQVFV